jgi:hypothetical protein
VCPYIIFPTTKYNIDQISEDKNAAIYCTLNSFRYKVFTQHMQGTVSNVMKLQSVTTQNGDSTGKGSMQSN